MPFARSDVMSVIISRALGGCNAVHSRPVENGAPAKIWQLDHRTCAQCADVLAHDPLWSGTLAEIPETPDEALEREQREKNSSLEQQNALGNLPDNLAGALGPALAAALAPLFGAVAAGQVTCREGHQNLSSAKFCAECGAPMASVPGAVEPERKAVEAPEPPPAAPKAAGNGARPKPLKDWRADDLRAEAGRLGLPQDGDRAALIGRIRAAKQAA
jgi:hypothetical protein